MMRLLRVEFTRFRSRRAVVLLLFAAFALPVLIGLGVAWDHRPVSDAEIAEAEQQIARDRDAGHLDEEMQFCTEHPRDWGIRSDDPAEVAAACEETVTPQLEWYLYRSELRLAEEFDFGSGFAVVVVVTALLMLAGTTFAGHDWNSGSVTNQLLFEPRRLRVWTAKALAVGLVTAVVATVVTSAYAVALWLVADAFDQDQPPGVLLEALQFGWRGAVLAAAAAIGAYAVTMFFRSTVGTLGIMAVVAVAGGLLLAALGIEMRWNPAFNAGAFVRDGITYGTSEPCGGPGATPGEMCWVEKEITFWQSATYFGVLLAVAVTLSLATFRRRDV